MLVTIRCPACSGDFRIPEALFASRFAGRETSIRCKKCNARLVVDGLRADSGQVVTRRRSLPPARSGARRSSVPPARRSSPPGHFTPATRSRIPEPRPSTPPASARALPATRASTVPRASQRSNGPPPLPLETSSSSASLRAVSVATVPAESEPPSSLAAAHGDEARTSPVKEASNAATPSRGRSRRGLFLPSVGAAALAIVVLFALGRTPEPARGSESTAAASTTEFAVIAATPVTAAPVPEQPEPAPTTRIEAASEVAAAAPVPAASVQPAYDARKLEQVLRWAQRNAEDCHRGGRPTGSARATLTFAPSGRVRDVRLEGEPVASAAVGKCILTYLRSPLIPPFVGPEFSVTREITLR